jgi:hypothetical protein
MTLAKKVRVRFIDDVTFERVSRWLQEADKQKRQFWKEKGK